jgi:hypothetical protein
LANSRPLLVGLCGYPKVGKSTVQQTLKEQFGLLPVDDGRPLRDIAKLLFGLTEEQVTTQEGKASYVTIGDKTWQVRDILGTLGDILEQTFGQQVIPQCCIRKALEDWEQSSKDGDSFHTGYSFGSVRKIQGKSYLEAGGEVVEVTRDGAGPSGYAFDEYDKSYVTKTIHNPVPLGEVDPEGLDKLRRAVMEAFGNPIT